MSGTKWVMGGFASFGKTGKSFVLALGMELVPPAGNDFMSVGLVPHIPDKAVSGRIETVMERQGQFYRPQIRCKMAAGTGNGLQEEGAELGGEYFQFFRGELFQVRRAVYGFKNTAHFYSYVTA